MTRRLADYIANGKPKVAMLTDDSGYGEQGRKALRESFTVDEVEVVSDQVIPRRARDLAPQILAARQAGADRLVVWASAADVAAALEAVHRANWDVEVLSGQTGEDPLIRQRLVANPEALARLKFVSSRITAEVGPEPFNAFRKRYEDALGADKVGVQQDGRDVIQPPDWAMYPYDALKLVENALSSSRAIGAPLLNQLNGGAQIVGANGDSRAYNADYHEGVSPADMYFARFDGLRVRAGRGRPAVRDAPAASISSADPSRTSRPIVPGRERRTCRACRCRRGCRSRACRRSRRG